MSFFAEVLHENELKQRNTPRLRRRRVSAFQQDWGAAVYVLLAIGQHEKARLRIYRATLWHLLDPASFG
jgi:hypothetical protein